MEGTRNLKEGGDLQEKLFLRLFVSGMSENSMLAISNLKIFCAKYARRGYELEIIDIYKDPSQAKEHQIIFTPSLIRLLPLPKKVFIGNMSNTKALMSGLGIENKE